MTPFKRVADGIYKYGDTTTYYERPKVNGKRTWRALKAANLSTAKIELARKTTERRNAEAEGRNPFAIPGNLASLAEFYVKSDCPDRKLRPRKGLYLIREQKRVERLLPFFKNMTAEQLSLEDCRSYYAWRKKQYRERKSQREDLGDRSIDMDLNTLSNILTWASRNSKQTGIRFNHIHTGRPRFRDPKQIRHSRDRMPATVDDIHKACGLMLAHPRSAAVGWQGLFAYLTGCRISELCRLRKNAKPMEPGWVDGGFLWLARSKGGVNPFTEIHPALEQCIKAHAKWHAETCKDSPWYFPNFKDATKPAVSTSLVGSLKAFCPRAGVEPVTAHGLRAFYVTVLRSKGISDAEIAAKIGDKTGAAIIASTYGAVPPNWKAGKEMQWLPTTVPVAWWAWE